MRANETEAEWRARGFAIEVHLLKVATGERAVHPDTGWESEYEPGAFEDYPWSEGNYSCDCNRDLFFCRALGREGPWGRKCSEGEFVVEKIVRVSDGATVYSEL